MLPLMSKSAWMVYVCCILIESISAVVVTYRATADSKDWTFRPPFEFHSYNPGTVLDPGPDVLAGSCISIDVVELSYGGEASIAFKGSAVFLHIVLVTTDLAADVRLYQGGRIVEQDPGLDPAGSEPTCAGDRFIFTDLDPNQLSSLNISASRQLLPGDAMFIIQGIEVIVPNSTFTSSAPTASQATPLGSTTSTIDQTAASESHPPPSSASSTTKPSSNVPLIAGAAVGGAVGCLALIFAGVAVLLCRRRRNARRQLNTTTHDGTSSVVPAHPDNNVAFDPTSFIERSLSGKVTTMSAGPSSPSFSGLASDGRPYSGYTSMAGTSDLSSDRPFSLPSESAGSSSLNRAGTMGAAPPAYGEVVSQSGAPPAAKQG